jgi:hypothetical protein
MVKISEERDFRKDWRDKRKLETKGPKIKNAAREDSGVEIGGGRNVTIAMQVNA